MSNANSNSFRLVGAGKTFLSPTDFIVQVDTSQGAVTLVLPKIDTILSTYTTIQQFIGVRFVDISNNASINNITIEGFETNTINGDSFIVLNTNGVGGMISLIGTNQWNFVQNSLTTSSTIEIPKVLVKSDGFSNTSVVEQIYFQFMPTLNLEFLNYNPRIFLFRYKKRTKNGLNGNRYIGQSKGWHHPTNNNGVDYQGAKFYGGVQCDIFGNPLPSRNTEIPIPQNATPYSKITADLSILTYLGFSKTQQVLTESDFPIALYSPLFYSIMFKGTGGVKSRWRNLRFAFCIGIDNPNKDPNNPIIFGEMSYPIFATFTDNGTNLTGIKFAFGTQNYGL